MPGIAKRKYQGEIIRLNKTLTRPLSFIQDILPYEYTKEDILKLFKELYPIEWKTINQRYENYKEMDKHLLKVGKKIRYKPEVPEMYLFNLPKVKHMLSAGQKSKYKGSYSEDDRAIKLENLKKDRLTKIEKYNVKVSKNKEHLQKVEPLYIDIFINEYHKKDITVEGKIEILKEIEKYECKKSLEFLYKINQSERNDQVRDMAFEFLQKTGNYVKLRKKFKGKKKSYMIEESDFFMKPQDLFERIKQDSIQNKKSYDCFISHSYKDNSLIKNIRIALNDIKLNIYCDWTSDNDFLKREYVGEYTKEILKKRIEQSKMILFVKTKHTNDNEDNFLSEWIKMELEYSEFLKKKIICIDLLNNGKTEYEKAEYNINDNTIKFL